jgi:hypothetical protein
MKNDMSACEEQRELLPNKFSTFLICEIGDVQRKTDVRNAK